jgi:hypothetical protein
MIAITFDGFTLTAPLAFLSFRNIQAAKAR